MDYTITISAVIRLRPFTQLKEIKDNPGTLMCCTFSAEYSGIALSAISRDCLQQI